MQCGSGSPQRRAAVAAHDDSKLAAVRWRRRLAEAAAERGGSGSQPRQWGAAALRPGGLERVTEAMQCVGNRCDRGSRRRRNVGWRLRAYSREKGGPGFLEPGGTPAVIDLGAGEPGAGHLGGDREASVVSLPHLAQPCQERRTCPSKQAKTCLHRHR